MKLHDYKGRGSESGIFKLYTPSEVPFVGDEQKRVLQVCDDVDISPKASPRIIGMSTKHVEILERISQMKNVRASVLITGESGTGKEVIARELHQASERANEEFQAINCGAIPENLLESELFGHKKGAFTDAKTDKIGLFEACTEGTLLLDEIGDLPLNLQVKLLRVLQEREVRRVGCSKPTKVDTRVVAATNKDLAHEVAEGRFRKDLFYRLSILKINAPTLRERPEDIPLLANSFLQRSAKRHSKELQPLSEYQVAELQSYSWPGNVRELQNSIERAVILAKNGKIELEHVFDSSEKPAEESSAGDGEPNGTGPIAEESFPRNYLQAKQVFEKAYLSGLLRATNGNVSEAARLAGKTRVEIYRFLKRNEIKPAKFRTH